MFNKIKENLRVRKDYKEAKKAVTVMVLNQYSDFLSKEIEAKDAEIKAYESMSIFGEDFKPEDLQNALSGINKIANSPTLQTSYYEKIHDETQKKKTSK